LIIPGTPDSVLWRHPPQPAELRDNEVHVWRAALDVPADRLARLRTTLRPDERLRAGRYHFDRDRDRFTAARGILRELLATYLRTTPAAINFRYGSAGKPALDGAQSDSRLKFNISHSHGTGLFAFARNRELGVDVELMREEFIGQGIAEHYFSAREVAELIALDPGTRTSGFFACWARKEAYIKATGLGLQTELHSFSVSLTPGAPATLISTDADRWSIQGLPPMDSFAGALVVEGRGCDLKFWEVNDSDAAGDGSVSPRAPIALTDDI